MRSGSSLKMGFVSIWVCLFNWGRGGVNIFNPNHRSCAYDRYDKRAKTEDADAGAVQ